MFYYCECTSCAKEWPCTQPLTMCLRCTEARGLVYGGLAPR
jgi:hypothetical protein